MNRATTLLVGIFFLLNLVLSCKTISNSNLSTTSDKLTEYSYIVSSTIEIPIKPEVYQLMHLINIHQPLLDHPDDSGVKARYRSITASADSFNADMAETMKFGYPVELNGQLDRSKLKFWIARQMRFTSQVLEKKGLSISVKNVFESEVRKGDDNLSYVVDYKAEVLGVSLVPDEGEQKTLVLGETRDKEITESIVPIDIMNVYISSMGSHFQDFYRRALSSVRENGIASLLKNSEISNLLEETTTNAMKNPCVIADGDNIVPHGFSYYFDPALPGCASLSGLKKLNVVESKKIPIKTTYPEFHRLFADGKVSFFYYFNDVDGEQFGASERLMSALRKAGLKEVRSEESDGKAWLVSYKGEVNGIEFEIDVGIEGGDSGAKEKFLESLKTHEVIIYDGHAGYGSNIDDSFMKEESYPTDSYQIFFLNGCSTYKYGMVQLLQIKAAKDLDFFNQNIDVITTYNSVKGSLQHHVIFSKLLYAASHYNFKSLSAEQISLYENNLTWLKIVTEINKKADQLEKDNGVFMVSGEQYNQFSPDGQHGPIKRNLSLEEVKKIALDPNLDAYTRISAHKKFVHDFFSSNKETSISAAVAKAMQYCLEHSWNADMHVVLADTFFLPKCQLRKVYLQEPAMFDSLQISSDKPVVFHLNGKIKYLKLEEPADIQGFTVKENEFTSFYPSGKLNVFYLKSERKFRDFAKISSSSHVVLYESGKFRKLSLSSSEDFHSIDGFELESWSQIILREDGRLISGRLHKKTDIQEYDVNEGARFELFDDLTVRSIDSLVQDSFFSNKNGEKLKSIEFRSPGVLRRIRAAEGSEFQFKGKMYWSIALRKDLSIAAAVPGMSEVRGMRFPCALEDDYDMAYYNRKGEMIGCKIGNGFKYRGEQISAGEFLLVDAEGTVLDVNNLSSISSYLEELEFMDIFESDSSDEVWDSDWN
ncbi:hypothetical protein N9D31_02225 [Oligoflexaceae bacterium]|nr:hypothetical protein [Oligoflexaceae bacterium]